MRRPGFDPWVGKIPWRTAWQEQQNDLCSFPRQTIHVTEIHVCAPTTNAKEAEVEQFCENLQDLLELTPKKKRCPLHHRGLECKSRKSRDIWSNRQGWLWGTKRSRAKANSFAKRTHWSEQTHSSNSTRDDSTHGHHQMVNTEIRLMVFFAAKDGEALYS